MTTKTSTNGTSAGNCLKATINAQQDYSNEAICHLNEFISKSQFPIAEGCETLVWDLLGSNCHFVQDEIVYMKQEFLKLLVSLTDPEISRKIKCSTAAGTYLKRIIDFLDHANNSVFEAQLKKAEVEFSGIDANGLQFVMNRFQV